MTTLFVAARAVHYASAMLLFGELVGLLGVAALASRRTTIRNGDELLGRFHAVARWSVVAGLASGAAWLAAETALMSGMPVAQAINRDTLGLVIVDTAFGRLWMLRAALLAVLGAALIAMRRSTLDARRSHLAILAALVAAAYLGTLAWAGHAVAAQRSEDDLQIAADVVHLLAAGAWLGALPMLAHLLGAAMPDDAAARAAQRFSSLGLACVAALVASGLVNAWHQVGDVPALVGTGYGRLLLAKLALFAALLALAIVNRGVLTQRVSAAVRGARRALQRNVVLEIALGIGVVTLVGKLGVTEPAVHQSALWPFGYTLSWQPMQESAWIQLVLAGAGTVAFVAAIVAVKGALGRPPRLAIAALLGIVAPAGVFAWLLIAPAHPTTYVVSPVGYTATAVARGRALYAANCSACHGRDGRGDGPDADSLPIRPQDLAERVPDRREGDLFWWIAHGIPGTPMPAFAPRLSDADIWNLIQLLDAQTAARNADAMTDRVKPLRPIAAPDFNFEFIGRPQESLKEPRGKRVTLLAFYTLPQSLPRLEELAMRQRAYAAAGARIIALPMDASSRLPGAGGVDRGEAIMASAGDEVAAAYAMFAQPGTDEGVNPPTHVEYLIDRRGYLRVRWIGVPSAPAERTATLLGQVDVLFHEPPPAPPQWGHRH